MLMRTRSPRSCSAPDCWLSVGIGCVLLSRVQRSRVSTIARLLDERTDLLAEMVTIEQREQRDLAETLHDGALQYVLAARQELEAVEEGDPEAVERIDLALAETSRLLRSTMTQLHPAVVDTAGLLPALRDLVETVNARGQLSAELRTRNWDDSLRTPIDELLLTTARELITNVVKHAQARTVSIELAREAGTATLRVSDDGVGMAGVDLDARLGAGHLGVASRRIRLEAAGGRITFNPADPHGTIVDVKCLSTRPIRCRAPLIRHRVAMPDLHHACGSLVHAKGPPVSGPFASGLDRGLGGIGCYSVWSISCWRSSGCCWCCHPFGCCRPPASS